MNHVQCTSKILKDINFELYNKQNKNEERDEEFMAELNFKNNGRELCTF